MPDVTFKCDCPESHVGVFVTEPKSHSPVASLLFQQAGTQALRLSAGVYDVWYCVHGTPQTNYGLGVTVGGRMSPTGGMLPMEGQDRGLCTLFVPATDNRSRRSST